MRRTLLATVLAIGIAGGLSSQSARAQDAWTSASVPASATATFDVGSVSSTNVAATLSSSGNYFVTNLGTAASGTFRRVKNVGSNTISFVMDGTNIVGFAPASPIGGPGGSGNSNVLPLAPKEVAEFVSLGSGSWQLVNYIPLGIVNYGFQANRTANGIPSTANPPDNWFQLGPIAGAGPEPDYSFAVNWTLHGGKLHTHGAYFMLPGDTPNIELRQADINSTDESPKPWTTAPYLGAHISGRALVDITGSGTYAFLDNTQSGSIGYNHSPSYLYQGFTANIDFPLIQAPTRNGTGGALVFKVTPNNTITPMQRGWFSNTGNLVEIGKAAWEACGATYPYNWSGTGIWQADAPCNDSDYYDTPGWGNISLVATDINGAQNASNAAIAIRKYGAHNEGLDTAYDATGNGTINRYGVHAGSRTLVEKFDPTTNNFTYPTKPAFRAGLTASLPNFTGDGTQPYIPFNTVEFDQANNFNTGTGAFTAPVAGIYQLEIYVQLYNVSTADNRFTIAIQTPSNIYDLDVGKLTPDVNGRVGVTLSVAAKMNAGDTAKAALSVNGSTKTVGVLWGGAGIPTTTFSGFLIG